MSRSSPGATSSVKSPPHFPKKDELVALLCSKIPLQASLVVQYLRIHLLMQGTWI